MLVTYIFDAGDAESLSLSHDVGNEVLVGHLLGILLIVLEAKLLALDLGRVALEHELGSLGNEGRHLLFFDLL